MSSGSARNAASSNTDDLRNMRGPPTNQSYDGRAQNDWSKSGQPIRLWSPLDGTRGSHIGYQIMCQVRKDPPGACATTVLRMQRSKLKHCVTVTPIPPTDFWRVRVTLSPLGCACRMVGGSEEHPAARPLGKARGPRTFVNPRCLVEGRAGTS